MKRKSKTTKPEARTYWMVESEYGLDVKRYSRTVCGSGYEAAMLCNYLYAKNPTDKHEIVQLKEVLK